jgi:hypothetical protein
MRPPQSEAPAQLGAIAVASKAFAGDLLDLAKVPGRFWIFAIRRTGESREDPVRV